MNEITSIQWLRNVISADTQTNSKPILGPAVRALLARPAGKKYVCGVQLSQLYIIVSRSQVMQLYASDSVMGFTVLL